MSSAEPLSAAALVGRSDLSGAVDEAAVCAQSVDLGANLFEITFVAPQLARLAWPGQFAQIQIDPGPVPLLRRPFSFSRADPDQGTISFYFGVVGVGTSLMASFRPGHQVRILGPLGRGFTLPKTRGRSLLISGGLGAAPLPLLAERLTARQEEVIWLNGARTAREVYPDHLIPAGTSRRVQFTQDGSAGRAGLVTDGLEDWLDISQRIYACGPNAMLNAVHSLWTQRAELPGPELEVSIEAPMGCGFGTCLGCAIPLLDPGHPGGEGPLGLCCRQGPVLAASALDWERLLRQPSHLE
ncbi:MAG TPA: dihydroorotate dehydrogenase electron transfer subunit [Candidatus Nanopelagicaceae bacterium]|nr:dihydroorotate dehydrogenase electron transfer subunit [Candidatus Nanopelagicaceae bacterium]